MMRGVLFALCLVAVAADKAIIYDCTDELQGACQILEARITPCEKYSKKYGCTLKKGVNATLSFDFIPNFNAASLTTGVFYQGQAFSDMGNHDACTMTACPVESGKQQEFSYQLHIGKRLPSGSFQFKWKVSNAENESQLCCFLTNVKLKA